MVVVIFLMFMVVHQVLCPFCGVQTAFQLLSELEVVFFFFFRLDMSTSCCYMQTEVEKSALE
jgi:hypothetical protein